MREVFKIKALEQVRLLSDPFKLQLLQAFAQGPKTTKQVATELNESVTKLYRHVDALHDAGLLLISEQKQKRGTVERTFQAVARRFEADHTLFSDEEGEAGGQAARDMLRVVEGEILQALARPDDNQGPEAIFMRLHCKASPQRITQLRAALRDWIDLAQEDDDDEVDDTEEIGALIAFYPVSKKD
jgi:predicted ArsR family transcriptional regulator